VEDQRIARAESLAALRRYDEVVALLADPGLNDDPLAVQHRVFALLNLDQTAQAHNEANRLVAMAPDSALSFLARSYSWESQNRSWDALKDARSAVQLAPLSVVARSRLATCLARAGVLDEAHEEVGWILVHEPDRAEHWVLLGRVYYHLNRFDEAEGALLEALRLDAQNTEAKVLLAGVHAESKSRKPEGIETLIDVLKENPSQTAIRKMLLELAFPAQIPAPILFILAALAVMLGAAVAIPAVILYGLIVAYRYRQLSPELRTLVMADPATTRRVRLAIGGWAIGVGAAVLLGIVLLLR